MKEVLSDIAALPREKVSKAFNVSIQGAMILVAKAAMTCRLCGPITSQACLHPRQVSTAHKVLDLLELAHSRSVYANLCQNKGWASVKSS